MSKKDWKKTIFRMKQLADQNLGRAEKSEVLSDSIRSLERRVDQLKMIHHVTSQRLTACLPPLTSNPDKRLRKMAESGLARSLLESAEELEFDTLGKSYKICGDVQQYLAQELLTCVKLIEQDVLKPFQTVLENEIPTINRLRKQLSKLTLDMDSAKGRYMSALKQAQRERSPPLLAKVETAKEEAEQAEYKVNQCRDLLITEMYTFFSKEGRTSDTLLKLLMIKINYHRLSLEKLEKCLPEIQQHIESSVKRPLYGCSLESHLQTSGRKISFVIEQCVKSLLKNGINEEGLFRVTSSTTRVKKLKAAFDAHMAQMDEYDTDPHCVAAALKMYLRELPEPLMTSQLYEEWIKIVSLPDELRQNALWVVVDKMPPASYDNLSYIIKFLAKLASHSEENKMSASNLAIVVGPSLLWPVNGDGPSILSASNHSSVVEWLINKSEWFFPGELDFGVTEAKLEVSENRRRSSSPYSGSLSRVTSRSVRDLSRATRFESNEPSRLRSAGLNPRAAFFEGKPPFGPSALDHSFHSSQMTRSASWRSRNSSLTDGSSLSGSANSLLDGSSSPHVRHSMDRSFHGTSLKRISAPARTRESKSYNGKIISSTNEPLINRENKETRTENKSPSGDSALSDALFPATDCNHKDDRKNEGWTLNVDISKSLESSSTGPISGQSGDTWRTSSSVSLPIVMISSPLGSSSDAADVDQQSDVFMSSIDSSSAEPYRRASSWSEGRGSTPSSPLDPPRPSTFINSVGSKEEFTNHDTMDRSHAGLAQSSDGEIRLKDNYEEIVTNAEIGARLQNIDYNGAINTEEVNTNNNQTSSASSKDTIISNAASLSSVNNGGQLESFSNKDSKSESGVNLVDKSNKIIDKTSSIDKSADNVITDTKSDTVTSSTTFPECSTATTSIEYCLKIKARNNSATSAQESNKRNSVESKLPVARTNIDSEGHLDDSMANAQCSESLSDHCTINNMSHVSGTVAERSVDTAHINQAVHNTASLPSFDSAHQSVTLPPSETVLLSPALQPGPILSKPINMPSTECKEISNQPQQRIDCEKTVNQSECRTEKILDQSGSSSHITINTGVTKASPSLCTNNNRETENKTVAPDDNTQSNDTSRVCENSINNPANYDINKTVSSSNNKDANTSLLSSNVDYIQDVERNHQKVSDSVILDKKENFVQGEINKEGRTVCDLENFKSSKQTSDCRNSADDDTIQSSVDIYNCFPDRKSN